MAQLKAIVDPLLTAASAGYFPSDADALCEQFLPKLPVETSTGKLGKYGKQHLVIESSIKAGRGAYRRVETMVRSTTNYSIDGHGLEGLVTPDDYRNVQDPFDAERDETLGLTSKIFLEKEYVLASGITDVTVLTQNITLSGSSQLSDYANSDPVSQFRIARQTVRDNCGVAPNVAALDWDTWNVIRYHPQLLDALGYKWNRPDGLTPNELAVAMGVKKLLVGGLVYNNAKEGQADSLSPIWGKDIVFAVAPDSAMPRQVSLGYMVTYKQMPKKVYKYAVNNPPQSNAILVEDSYQFLISDATAGYLIKASVA